MKEDNRNNVIQRRSGSLLKEIQVPTGRESDQTESEVKEMESEVKEMERKRHGRNNGSFFRSRSSSRDSRFDGFGKQSL